ncbi:MAG: RagB/SusD family nutrient uptake outer membrane protein, partial [Bacteroidota bacterium]
AFAVVLMIGLSSCGEDFLTAYPTDSQEAGGEATKGAIEANVASAYQILLFDSYADFQYNSIVLMSDLRSDDIFKGGGDAGDQAQLYRLSQLDATPRELPGGLWNIYYSGISRANNAIIACENAVDVSEDELNRLSAEAHFLRAYYLHWLWKFWGNIPYFEEDLDEPYMAPQYSADEIYAEIIEDLDYAIEGNKLPMNVSGNEDGRATRAAAMMLKARVVMYQKDQDRYDEVLADMAEIINDSDYGLMDNYAEIWPRSGQFCKESIFEVNHLPEGRDWGAAWTGYGTNLPAFIAPNGLNGTDQLSGDTIFTGGWGFGPVRPDVPDIFNEGDERLAASINQFAEGTYTERFQDTGLFMAKYAAREEYNDAPYTPDLNYENNLRIFRYAETLLNAAELIAMHGVSPEGGLSAQDLLDQVRRRAMGDDFESVTADPENIKEERRREFIGEGMRFWDLVRWGDADILTENNEEYSSERTWESYKKYLPIPQSEIDRTEGEFKLEQNDGY